jgi:hypothetical protein
MTHLWNWRRLPALRWPFLAAVLLVLASPVSMAAQSITLEVQAHNTGRASFTGWSMEAEIAWGGVRRVVSLDNNGIDRWRGTIDGLPTQMVGVILRARGPGDGPPHLVYSGLEVLESGSNSLFYGMSGPPPGTARRRSMAASGPAIARRAEATALIGMSWWLVVLLGIVGLARRGKRRLRTGLDEAGWRFRGRWEPWMWFGLAGLWTWPAVRAGPGMLVGRHFDALGTIWTISAADRLLPHLTDAWTGWPAGVAYGTIDSFTLLPMAALLAPLGPVRLHGWLSVLGVATSAWAASAFARAAGAPRPWNLMAGVLFALSGLAANALLEGHIYHLLDPWLPLFAWCWWRATGTSGRMRDGVGAGVAFSLTLLTTAYLGVAAAVIALGFAAGALLTHARRFARPLLGFVLIALPVGLWLLSALASQADPVTQLPDGDTLRRASLTMTSIGLPTAEMDRVGHSWAMVLSPLVIAAMLVAPLLLPRESRWRTLVFTSVLALVLSMGPSLALGNDLGGPAIPSPLAWIWSLPGGAQLRFPGRIAWAFNLVGGVLAARVAAELAHRVGRPARWLLVAALFEALVLVALPARQVSRPTMTADLADSGTGPIFSLLPEATHPSGEADSWMGALDCLAQLSHGRPISGDCVRVPVRSGSGAALSRWVAGRILEGNGPAAWQHLRSQEFETLLWRPDWVHPTVAARVDSALAQLGAPARLGDAGWQLYDLSTSSAALSAVTLDASAAGILAAPSAALASAPAVDWRPTISLIVPQDAAAARYFARLKVGDAEPERVEFRDGLGVPGDVALDGVWEAQWRGSVTGLVTLALEQVRLGDTSVLWRGPVVPMPGLEDPLVFRVDGNGQEAAPILAALSLTASNQYSRAGWIHLGGVVIFGGLWLGWVVARRRQIVWPPPKS